MKAMLKDGGSDLPLKIGRVCGSSPPVSHICNDKTMVIGQTPCSNRQHRGLQSIACTSPQFLVHNLNTFNGHCRPPMNYSR